MGDRALVIFTDGNEVSPVVYLHWNASEVPAWLEEHKAIMASRGADVHYATARFIGLAHARVSGNLSLGCWNTPPGIAEAVLLNNDGPLDEYSHGAGGVVVVDVNDYTWRAVGGYLTENQTAKAA